jgi:hypothetical protein
MDFANFIVQAWIPLAKTDLKPKITMGTVEKESVIEFTIS